MTVPLRPTTPKRASDSERPLNPGGAGGIPPATLCVQAFSRESLDPPPGTGRGTTSQVWTCAGPNPAPLPGAARCCVPFGWVARKHPRGAVPWGPACPAGSPFLSREMGERGSGRCPLDPGVYGPLTLVRSFWGSLSLIRSRGDFLRYAKIDLGRIFRGKICCKAFLRKKAPKSGHADGCRNSPTTGTMCPTTPKRASANERTIKEGGPGGKAPGALSSGFLRRKPGSRPESGGEPRRRSGPALVQTRTTCRQQRRPARPAGRTAPQLTGQADVL